MSTNKIGFSEGAGLNIASFSFEEDGVTKHMERIAPGAGVLAGGYSFAPVATIGLVALSLNTKGKGRIMVLARCETGNTDYFTFRLVYKDADGGIMGTGPLSQCIFTELTSGGSPNWRYGTISVFANDGCASSVELYVVALPATGTLNIAMVAA